MDTAKNYFPEIVKEIWEENEPEQSFFLKDFWKICTINETTMYAKPYMSEGVVIGLEFYLMCDSSKSLRDTFGGIYGAKTLRSKKCTFEEFLDNHNVSQAHFYLYAH